MKCDMQNKYIPLQIDCDFSVRFQILQLQVLKTFATIIPSYNTFIVGPAHEIQLNSKQSFWIRKQNFRIRKQNFWIPMK